MFQFIKIKPKKTHKVYDFNIEFNLKNCTEVNLATFRNMIELVSQCKFLITS
jgi:hypothetical protein